jgi:hypothetical protein
MADQDQGDTTQDATTDVDMGDTDVTETEISDAPADAADATATEPTEATEATTATATTTTTGTTGTSAVTSTDPVTEQAVPEPIVPATQAAPTVPAVTQIAVPVSTSNKRGRSAVRSVSPVVDAVTSAAVQQAAQQVAAIGLQGLAGLLIGILQPGGGGISGGSGGSGGSGSSGGLAASGSGNAALGLGASSLAPTSAATEGTTATIGGGADAMSASDAKAAAAAANTILPTPDQVRLAAIKAVAENPPWTHWSKNDSAVRCIDKDRLSVAVTPVSGYRMARASQAVVANTHTTVSAASASASASTSTDKAAKTPQALYYYYECLILPGPTAQEVADALPPNARLGPKLQDQLQRALLQQQQQETAKKRKLNDSTADNTPTNTEKDNDDDDDDTGTTTVGGHVRLGWSMRTGDLQAPVGYDKWSFAIRDTAGSILHASLRQDDWGGQAFGPGDVVGCAILLHPNNNASINNTNSNNTNNNSTAEKKASTQTQQQQAQAKTTAPLELSGDQEGNKNEIRFFKNGECLGQFVLSKGKRVGGVAFDNVESGSYYPAVSCYMGGSVQANFGPHWIHPPRRKLPAGLGKLVPVSQTSPPPLQPDDAVAAVQAAAKLFRKPEQQHAFRQAVRQEAVVLCQAYEEYMNRHVDMIRKERIERGLSVQDLPEPPAVSEHTSENDDGKTDDPMNVEASSAK